jgi:hypothetical protein
LATCGAAPALKEDYSAGVEKMLEVIGAVYLEGFKIRVSFNNGDEGVVDLSEALWGPVFEPLKDPKRFKKFRVSDIFHTVDWENGADFAPEYLYDKMVEQAAEADH